MMYIDIAFIILAIALTASLVAKDLSNKRDD